MLGGEFAVVLGPVIYTLDAVEADTRWLVSEGC